MKNLILEEIMSHIKGNIIQGNIDAVIKRVVTKPNKIKDNTLFFYFDKKNKFKIIPVQSINGCCN